MRGKLQCEVPPESNDTTEVMWTMDEASSEEENNTLNASQKKGDDKPMSWEEIQVLLLAKNRLVVEQNTSTDRERKQSRTVHTEVYIWLHFNSHVSINENRKYQYW